MTMTSLRAVAQQQTPSRSADPTVPRAALAPGGGLLFLSGMCGLIFQVGSFLAPGLRGETS
jgi:hypothetical protein